MWWENSIRSSTLKCISKFHNKESPGINSTIYNFTTFDYEEQTIIRQGTIVYNQAERCDGTYECLDLKDEMGCGFNTFDTLFFGNFTFNCLFVTKATL